MPIVHHTQPSAPLDQQAVAIDAQDAALDLVGGVEAGHGATGCLGLHK